MKNLGAGVAVIRPEEPFEFVISGGKSISISAKIFFFLEITYTWAEKPFEFPISAEKSGSVSVKTFFFLEITYFWEEKPPQSDSRAMEIWVKLANSCLNLPKKPPPPFTKSWLRSCEMLQSFAIFVSIYLT